MKQGYENQGIEVKIISVNSSSGEFEVGSQKLEDRVNDWLSQSENTHFQILDMEYKMERIGSPNEYTIVFSVLIVCKK